MLDWSWSAVQARWCDIYSCYSPHEQRFLSMVERERAGRKDSLFFSDSCSQICVKRDIFWLKSML
ncbi:hypothetical protein Krac_9245 [Ktedonobacter racemifer DSM 44963]|uniref:Uncharacterized protein n=1 Tax=Ktedonobacter racemifer DSM 44963 TaxID=485913 RepID=D6TBB0_KTERA|nr:hypothetical protein Krac_9245 [Ktedonobacter racemifer DSM 44963]